MARKAKVSELAVAGVLGCGAAVAAPAAETIELKFDWGSGFTVLRDIEPAKAVAKASSAIPAVAPPAAGGGAAAGTGASASAGAGAGASPASAAAAPPPRLGQPAYRFRLAVVVQPDGSYEIRVIDFLMRTEIGDLLIPQTDSSRRISDASFPAVSLDGRGAFVRLLEPDRVVALFQDASRDFEERLKNLPPAKQQEARAQFEELRSLGQASARAAFAWSESVGFWAGRRLTVGETYTEKAEQRYMPIGSGRGPARIERQWRAVGRVACEDAPANGKSDALALPKDPGRPAASPDCVRLILKSTFSPSARPVASPLEDKRELRYESEIDLVTEPATLRPRRAQQVWLVHTVSAKGEKETREWQRTSMRWTYGDPALVALKNSMQGFEDTVPFAPGAEPPNLRPMPVWAEGTPEKVYLDYRAASDAWDWGAAAAFLHPEFVARMAKRLRGTEGARASEAMRRELVGDEVTLEQVDALSDPALVLLVAKRRADTTQRPAVEGTLRLLNKKIVLGHVEDREGRVHLVTQDESEYRLPVQYRGSSSTAVMALADQRSMTAEPSGGPPAERCDPVDDVLRCWRVWRDTDAEYGAIFRARDRVSPPSRRVVSGNAQSGAGSAPTDTGKSAPAIVAPASAPAVQNGRP